MQVEVTGLVANLLACPHATDEAEFRECLEYVSMPWICQRLPDLRAASSALGGNSCAGRKAILSVLVNIAVFGKSIGL